jgi:hypothetical protein
LNVDSVLTVVVELMVVVVVFAVVVVDAVVVVNVTGSVWLTITASLIDSINC